MESATSTSKATPAWPRAWLNRVRFSAAVALVWAALCYGVQPFFLPPALDRPVVVTLVGGIGAALAVLVVMCGGVALGAGLTSRAAPGGVTAALLALAIWIAPSGTMDQYLQLALPSRDSPASTAYLLLLVEYGFWAVCLLAMAAIGQVVRDGVGLPDAAAWRRAVASWFPPPMRAEASRGVLAGLASLAIAALLLTWLNGPRVQWTHRGQVYFAVLIAFWAGPQVTFRLLNLNVRRPVWFVLGPFVLGVIGVVSAAFVRLPPPFTDRNALVVHHLARPLPVEMVALGLLAVLHSLRTLGGGRETSE